MFWLGFVSFPLVVFLVVFILCFIESAGLWPKWMNTRVANVVLGLLFRVDDMAYWLSSKILRK